MCFTAVASVGLQLPMTPCSFTFKLTVHQGVKVGDTIGGHVVEVVELGLRWPADVARLSGCLESQLEEGGG